MFKIALIIFLICIILEVIVFFGILKLLINKNENIKFKLKTTGKRILKIVLSIFGVYILSLMLLVLSLFVIPIIAIILVILRIIILIYFGYKILKAISEREEIDL